MDGGEGPPPAGGGSDEDGWLTVVGSGTLVPDAERGAAAHFAEVGGSRILFDCGPGTLRGLAAHGVPWTALTHVAVSHYHLDHVRELSALLFAMKHGITPRRTLPLVLVGPRGFGAFIERLAGALGRHLVEPGFDVEVVELGEGDEMDLPSAGTRLQAHPTPHTAESVAFRLDAPGGSVGYTGDTGPSEALAAFLWGCAVLVAECAQADPPSLATHLSPSGLAAMAEAAEPGVLVVTHVVPPLTPDEAVRQVAAAGYRGRVVAGVDGMRLPFPGRGGPQVDPLPPPE